MFELTEEEFLMLVKERMEKANLDKNEKVYEAHAKLLDSYYKFKTQGYKLKFYLKPDSGELIVIPFSKRELELYRKKYMESGIY